MSRGKVLLFRPVAEVVKRKVDSRKPGWIPYSLLSIAGPVVEAGFDVQIVDGYLDEDYEAITREHVPGCVCVGITTLTGYQIQDGLRFAGLARQADPDVPLVWGGFHPSLFPEQTIEHELVDIIGRGQGEATFAELVERLADGAPLDDVAGITFQKNGETRHNPDRPFVKLDNFPPYKFDLVDLDRYVSDRYPKIGKLMVSYVSSQGCPYNCGFCAEAAVRHRRWSGLSPDRVIDDLTFLTERTGADAVFIGDNNFFVKMSRAEEICRRLIDEGPRIKWYTDARVDLLSRCDERVWELMEKSGCRKLLIGAESGSQEILDYINKQATVEQCIRFLERCAEHNIIAECSLMCGFPMAPKNDLEETMRLVEKAMAISPHHEIMLFIYTPYPGTPLYEKAIAAGLKPPGSFEGWADYSLRNINTPWLDRAFEERYEFFQRVFHFVFTPKVREDYIKNGKSMLLYNVLHQMAKLRWRHRFFGFPVEGWLSGFKQRLMAE